jgi:hypothetical protein
VQEAARSAASASTAIIRPIRRFIAVSFLLCAVVRKPLSEKAGRAEAAWHRPGRFRREGSPRSITSSRTDWSQRLIRPGSTKDRPREKSRKELLFQNIDKGGKIL